MAGPCDLLVHVVAPSLRELGAHVTRVRTTLSALSTKRNRAPLRFDAADRALSLALGADGRASTAALAMAPEVRRCAALTGAENLMLVVSLPSPHDVLALEALPAAKLPWLEITGRAVTLRSVKLMGRLLDAAGRVPLDFWAAVPVPEHGDRSVHRSGG